MQRLLPIIQNVSDLNLKTISQLIEIGFTYVKLPRAYQIEKSLKRLHDIALNFFRNDDLYKNQWAINEKFEGYVDREYGKNPQTIKQFIFRPENPIGPFKDNLQLINEITQVFQAEIGLNLVKKIFQHFNLEDKYQEVSTEIFSSFSFSYYPENPQEICTKALNEHKDFDMITVLWINKPGLEVFYGNNWHRVDPVPQCVVVNLANALELMLGKKCKSALHRVRLTNEERLSFGTFIGPNINKPVIDYTTNKVCFNRYTEYLDSQFNRQYEETR